MKVDTPDKGPTWGLELRTLWGGGSQGLGQVGGDPASEAWIGS